MEPKISELVILPRTISFSHLQDFTLCAYFYYLSHIKKLRKFTNNTFTVYGTLLHRCLQDILMKNANPDDMIKKFDRTWNKFCSLYKQYITKDLKPGVEPLDLKISAFKSIKTVKDQFNKQFGPHKVLAVEEWLRQATMPPFTQQFVGCIDIVLQLSNGDIKICDFKSCDSSFMFMKYMDSHKEYQLTLYKKFYADKHHINLDKIETYFVTLERNKKSVDPLKFLRITSGDKKIANAINWLKGALDVINGGRFLKNRSACHKFGEKHPCIFYNTPNCTRGDR